MRIHPFRAWRPQPEWAAQVAAPPYDVLDSNEARALAKGNPLSFLHVNKAEIDLPPTVDVHDTVVYNKAIENFRRFRREGVLVQEPEPTLYLYRLIRAGHAQTGLVACCHAADYERDVIRKHEKTLKAKEDDRMRHVVVLNAHTGPVFLAYRPQAELDALTQKIQAGTPLFDFKSADGVQNTLWRVPETSAWVQAFAGISVAYIADGHHRAAAAVRVAQERRAANPRHTGAEEYNWFMAVLFPADQLRILPYNRCVQDLHGLTVTAFLKRVQEAGFTVKQKAKPQPAESRNVSLYVDHQWLALEWPPDPKTDAVSCLDVSVLQDRLLGPILGIDDPRKNPRIEFVGGIRGSDELQQRVDSGRAAVAFSMYPTTMDQLLAIADAGQIMPPKSTWFEPKLKDGLFLHDLG
ncbi:MAG: DUF1015 domain-containing protein [Verrucomicrobia bacterium]|nr:MAG: DUF1015 domain-containing protein [Verrucomicrobiota bacterium]